MTNSPGAPQPRKRGSIRLRGSAYQVRVSAGQDPATGERVVLSDSVPVDKPGYERSERAARKEAEKVLTRLQAQADELKAASTKATFGALLDRWLPQHEVDRTTWGSYESIVRLYLRPAFGEVPLALLTTKFADRMERYYGDLRRCSQRCIGRPFIEHRERGTHDCNAAGCEPHRCKPLSASYVHRIHAVMSAALSAATRWEWITHNPADTVRLPAKRPPQPRPPTPAQMAEIIEAAWHDDDEWGLYIWLSAVTGARRGELVAVQFDCLDLENRRIELRGNYVWSTDGLIFKDTKTHQLRFVALDDVTVELLAKHKRDCAIQLQRLGVQMTGKEFVFSREPTRAKPRDPSSISRRYCRLMRHLSIDSELRQLRHYSATELLTAGVDLRTVAGRLGHGDGTTTLRHYVAWVLSADQHAAKTIGSRMPKLPEHRRTGVEHGQREPAESTAPEGHVQFTDLLRPADP